MLRAWRFTYSVDNDDDTLPIQVMIVFYQVSSTNELFMNAHTLLSVIVTDAQAYLD